MAIIEPTVDHIDDETLMRELRNLAGAVDKNETALNKEMAQISQRQDQVDESIAGFQSQIDANKSAIENEVVARQNADDSEAEARQQADITGASLSIVSGAIQLMLNRALGAINANVTAPFIKTMELIPTATERSFKVRSTYWPNTQYDTNDFVIPAGGGTDVSVTGVTIQDGTTPNSFQVQIELSDGTPISSNDYPFPEAVINPYPTSLTLGLSGTTLNVSIGLSNSNSVSNTVDLAPLLNGYATQAWVTSQLGSYATDTELTEIQSDLQEQITSIKPTVTVNDTADPPTITVAVNGSSSTANLPSNEGIIRPITYTDNNEYSGGGSETNAEKIKNHPRQLAFIYCYGKSSIDNSNILVEFIGLTSNGGTSVNGLGYAYSLNNDNKYIVTKVDYSETEDEITVNYRLASGILNYLHLTSTSSTIFVIG